MEEVKDKKQIEKPPIDKLLNESKTDSFSDIQRLIMLLSQIY